jgi:hypothetical protein
MRTSFIKENLTMKRFLFWICLTVTLVLGLVPAAALAEVEVFHFRGKTAEAGWVIPEAGGCVSTWVDVFLFEDRFQSSEAPRENSPWAAVLVTRYDQCQSLFLAEVSGFVNLSADDYSFGGALRSAHLGVALEGWDYIANVAVPITVDLDWEGNGEAVQTSSSGRWSSPHYRTTSRSRGVRRDAIATGSVLLGTANVTPGPSTEAGVGSVQGGSVTSYH